MPSCKKISNLPTTDSCEVVLLAEDADGNLVQFSPDNIAACLEIPINEGEFESLTVTNNATIGGNLSVTGDITLDDLTADEGSFSGDLGVAGVFTSTGGATFSGTVDFSGASVSGIGSFAANDMIVDDLDADVISARVITTTEGITVGQDLDVQGDTDVIDLNVAGALDVQGTTNIEGATTVDDDLTVTGDTSLQDTVICGTLSFCNPSVLDLANVTISNASALVTTKFHADIQEVNCNGGSVTATLTHSFGTLPKYVKLKVYRRDSKSNVDLLSGTNIDGATTDAYLPSVWSEGYEIPGGTKECLWMRNDSAGGSWIQNYLGYVRTLTNQTPTTDNKICAISIQSYSTTNIVVVFDGSGGGTWTHINENLVCFFEIYG